MISATLAQIVSDTENLIYDAGGKPLSDGQRFDLLVQKLYKLDEGASWKAELKSPGQGHSKLGGGRGGILNVREGKTTTNAIRNICYSNLHTGACSKGDNCWFVHLTSAQRKVYPMCADKRCTRGNSCMFRHAGDEINLAAEEPEKGGAKPGAAGAAQGVVAEKVHLLGRCLSTLLTRVRATRRTRQVVAKSFHELL